VVIVMIGRQVYLDCEWCDRLTCVPTEDVLKSL
jgi:hypothetical protein